MCVGWGVYPDVAECIQPMPLDFDRDFDQKHSSDMQRDTPRRRQESGGAYSQSCWSAMLSMALAGSRVNPNAADAKCRAVAE